MEFRFYYKPLAVLPLRTRMQFNPILNSCLDNFSFWWPTESIIINEDYHSIISEIEKLIYSPKEISSCSLSLRCFKYAHKKLIQNRVFIVTNIIMIIIIIIALSGENYERKNSYLDISLFSIMHHRCFEPLRGSFLVQGKWEKIKTQYLTLKW